MTDGVNFVQILILIGGHLLFYRLLTQHHSSVQDTVITNVNNTNMSNGDIDNQKPFVPKAIAEELLLLDAVALSVLHPWKRDARLIEKAIEKGPKYYSIIVEIACTRSSSELLGARKAYHSLFDRSMEEDIAANIHGSERKFLVALVSADRYEGPKLNEGVAKYEAEILYNAIENADKRKLIEDEETIIILTKRSKPHLRAVYQHYNKIYGKTITEDLEAEGILKDIVECLCTPETYFTRVLDAALSAEADEEAKRALARVIVTQKGASVKEGYDLPNKVEGTLTGFYKDFMLRMAATGENKISQS